MKRTFWLTAIAALMAAGSVSLAWANSCPASHPLWSENCQQCFTDEAQAISAGCGSDATGNTGNTNPGNTGNAGSGSQPAGTCSEVTPPPSNGGQGDPGVLTVLDPVAYNCVSQVGNGNDGCINMDGLFVTRCGVVSNPANTKEALLDIEFNLGIDLDDVFIANSGYQGVPPSVNPVISVEDATTYFVALIGQQKGQQLANDLNTNGDGWLTRDEATAAKGADPLQVLNTGFGNGLATDDVLAYIGLYFGDGALDKYAGDLDPLVKDNMLQFTRTWQPGTDAITGRYTGPGTGTVVGTTGDPDGSNNGDDGTAGSGEPESPDDTGTSPGSSPTGSMGLEYIDSDTAVLYHSDAGFTGSWHYLCINGECISGTNVNGRYQREVIAYAGNRYNLEFKIQDNSSGQCLTGEIPVSYTTGGAPVADTPCD